MTRSVRTFFWQPALSPPSHARRLARRLARTRKFWTVGNFGDLVTQDLLQWRYRLPVRRVSHEGSRLLITGSIAQFIAQGDIVAGIGVKRPTDTLRSRDITVVGLRGPRTLEWLRRQGVQSESLAFMGDPGLLVSKMWPTTSADQPRGWVLIPHYHDEISLRRRAPRDLQILSPDSSPEAIAQAIRNSEGVISSSLHGLIFAHSYGRPAIALRPSRREPTFKYLDYWEGVGLTGSFTDTLDEALTRRTTTRAMDVSAVIDSIRLPDQKQLDGWGVLEE